MSPQELNTLIEKLDSKSPTKKTSHAMKRAMHQVLIDKTKWRSAALDCGVTESGICRAIQRIKAVNLGVQASN
jgi:hypothetical protein